MPTAFTLTPNPTFKSDVKIPVPGGEPGELTFIFKHYPLKTLAEMEKTEGKPVAQFLMDIVEGWALPEAFTRENLDTLLDNYPQASTEILRAYYAEMVGAREKN